MCESLGGRNSFISSGGRKAVPHTAPPDRYLKMKVKEIMGYTIPSDVLAFLSEFEQLSSELIAKYYEASEKDETGTKSFEFYAPISVRVFTDEGELARFYEEGVDIYPAKE